jgi:hypothetical protein
LAIDQETAHASFAHLGKGDLLGAVGHPMILRAKAKPPEIVGQQALSTIWL